ncbi:MAG: hypothetical protein ACT4QG_22660 [Sporichthyaceae bacterium]
MRRTARLGVAAIMTAAALVGTTVFGAASASATESREDGLGELITQFRTMSIGGLIRLDNETGRTSLVDVEMVTGLVDRAGELIGSLASVPVSLPKRTGPDIGKFSCIKQGSARNFRAFDPAEIYYDDRRGVQQYQFRVYRKTDARRMDLGAKSTQYEVCGTGGMDLKDGHRAFKAGLGFAFPDASKTHRIGYKWKTGTTPADYSLSMGFQLGNDKTPLSIGASINQTPGDKLTGSFDGPGKGSLDQWKRNGVNAWWQDSCISGWSRCKLHADGSPNFQGTVAHGLYEFRPEEAAKVTHFAADSYLDYACQAPFDMGC